MTEKWTKKDYIPIIRDAAEAIAVAQTANIMSGYDAWANGSELDLWLDKAKKSLLRVLKDDNEAAQQTLALDGAMCLACKGSGKRSIQSFDGDDGTCYECYGSGEQIPPRQ